MPRKHITSVFATKKVEVQPTPSTALGHAWAPPKANAAHIKAAALDTMSHDSTDRVKGLGMQVRARMQAEPEHTRLNA